MTSRGFWIEVFFAAAAGASPRAERRLLKWSRAIMNTRPRVSPRNPWRPSQSLTPCRERELGRIGRKRVKSQLTANTARFAERLGNLMLERRPPLTQTALAETVGVTRAAVSRWLRQNRFPYPRHLNKICAVLGVHRQWLKTGKGEKRLRRLHTH